MAIYTCISLANEEKNFVDRNVVMDSACLLVGLYVIFVPETILETIAYKRS
jgi:hypothetical protein